MRNRPGKHAAAHHTRWRRRPPRSAILALIVGCVAAMLTMGPEVAQAETGPATVSVSGTSPRGAFSPNGDGFDDALDVLFCLDAAANVTATAIDATDTVVRTIASNVSF